jgi:hypothetical protein
MITAILWLLTAGMTATFLLSKCFFLARTRLGVAMMLANVLYETAFKRLGLLKWHIDAIALPFVVGAWWFLAGSLAAVVLATLMALAWGGALVADLNWRSGAFAHQHTQFAGRVELPIPELLVVVRGPILHRGRCYELGDWPEGLEQSFTILVTNPGTIHPQLPLVVTVASDTPGFLTQGAISQELSCPDPGQLQTARFSLCAPPHPGSASARVSVQHGDFVFRRTLHLRSVIPRTEARVRSVQVTRWKYGSRAAFAWRGDQDLYDPATFQSVDGLRASLRLAQRFHLPTTLFLSGRLSLVEQEHREFCQHFGWDRRSQEIPAFIDFLRRDVQIAVEQDWPVQPEKPFAFELGNHMYLHYGTHAAAAPGNNWKSHARICEGHYSWDAAGQKDSFTEQRDNALKNAALVNDLLGAEMATYAIPSNVYDAETARAVEAAGLEFGSDTNAGAFINVFLLPPPHHPQGCSRLVELTRKYPRDPDDANKVAVLKYWAYHACRTGRAFILLCHHHLALYEGVACYHLMEKLLWDILADSDGDFYPATMGAIGRYWMRVLSPNHRWLEFSVVNGQAKVVNRGSETLTGIPLTLEFEGGGQCLYVTDLAAGATASLSFSVPAQQAPV